MTELPAILVGIALANDFVLVKSPSPAPGRLSLAGRIAAALALSLMLSALLSSLLITRVLVPAGLEALALLAAAASAFAVAPLGIRLTGNFAPQARPPAAVVGIECAMLTVVLLVIGRLDQPVRAAYWAIGIGLGYSVLSLLFASLRARFDSPDLPPVLRGPVIALLTAGFMTLALSGAAGMLDP